MLDLRVLLMTLKGVEHPSCRMCQDRVDSLRDSYHQDLADGK